MSLENSRRYSSASIARDRSIINFYGSGSRQDIIHGRYPPSWETEYSTQFAGAQDELLHSAVIDTDQPPYPPQWLLTQRQMSQGYQSRNNRNTQHHDY
ncbi:hypothetical protein PROFUN_12796, partial [Planoprotostelium fungivorum]